MSAPYRDLNLELSVTRYLVPTTSSLLDMGSSDPSYRSVEHDRIAELLPAMLRTACPVARALLVRLFIMQRDRIDYAEFRRRGQIKAV